MDDLKHSIETARAKGLDDKAIKNLLVKSGWDADVADAALLGIFVPAPATVTATSSPKPATAKEAAGPSGHHSLSALEAAVHHVLLWFFTGSLSITIGVVSATLFGNETSITAVSSFIAATIITLLPYGFFYLRYMRQLRKDPDYTTGRVWSIITIVLHSLVAMGGLITLVATAINAPDDGLPIFVAATMISIVNLIVVAAYAHATFVGGQSRRRKLILKVFPVILILLLAGFIIASFGKVGPLREDEQTRRDLVTASRNVRDFVEKRNVLPDNGQELDLPAGVEYERFNSTKYRLCANFKVGNGDSRGESFAPTDGYIDTYNFYNNDKGRECFTVESQQLRDASVNIDAIERKARGL